MHRLTENKIVLVTRKTRLDDIIARFNTVDQARFYVEHLGSNFSDYQEEDRVYKQAVAEVESQLKALGRVQVLERSFVPNFIFGGEDTVVVLGQDGLVANTLKYLDRHPVIAINPDPSRWDGILLPFHVPDAGKIVRDLFSVKRPVKEITFAKAQLNNGQCLYAVNDLFIGPKSHSSARYELEIDQRKEQQSSSGIIVSTGLGSTGWLKSVVAGASGVTNQEVPVNCAFDWNADYLWYSVREPFPSNVTGTELVFGKISASGKMMLTSQMAGNGVIFSDGVEADFIEFNSGMKASIGVADKKGLLIQ